MPRRSWKIWSLVALLFVGATLSFLQSTQQTVQPSIPVVMVSQPAPTKQVPVPVPQSYGLPVQLQISHLKIDAKVSYMGKTEAGAMDTPTNVSDVGWYKYGALPGNIGTAVLAGHLDGLQGEPGVFSQLKLLQPGDIVSVRDNTGKSVNFQVRVTKSYGQDEQPAEVFSSSEGAHLNLITCTGAWDKTARQFAQRLVVFTDRI